MKKYKYSRKEWLEYYENNVHIHITQEAKKDLLAKESNEEYSQRIMMEQVPKEEDNKECKHQYLLKQNHCYCVICGKSTKPTPSPLDDICEIKRFILVTDGSDVVLYPEIKDMAIKLNEVIKTVNLIIKQLKQK